ncbi:MAG: hypothetical protein ACXVEE_02960 [Polyangiales bacterium]
MLRVSMDVEAGNRSIKNGAIGKVMEATMERIKPEAAYFTADGGKRTAYFVFDLKDPSDIPSIAEPFFMQLGASIDMMPVMNRDDLSKGLEKASKNF